MRVRVQSSRTHIKLDVVARQELEIEESPEAGGQQAWLMKGWTRGLMSNKVESEYRPKAIL